MSKMDGADIKLRYERLFSSRQTINEIWDNIERYIAPYRGRFFKDERSENSVEWRKVEIFDSTAVMASQSLAAHIHSSLTSPKIKWFDLRFRENDLNEDQEAIIWLDEVSKLLYKTLTDSNFTVQAGETYQDLVDFGTSAIVEEVEDETNWKGINFNSIPIKECYFEQDHKGNIYNFYRKLEWTAIQIMEKFGREACPEWILEKVEDPQSTDEKEILIMCIYRRESVDLDKVDLTKPLAPTARPYGLRWILHKDASQLGDEGGYYEMPAFIPRWRKTSSSMWGNSPAMIALNDTITLNRLIELHIQAMEKVIDPAILTTERGLISDLDLNPGGVTVVRNIDEVRPFESSARFDINYQEILRYRDQIREYFMIDQLQLPPMAGQGNPASATEIAARVSQLERLIGPTLGRLQSDFLDPLIERTFAILVRAGRLPEPPQSVIDNPSGLDIEYVGALARSQQQDQVDAVDRWMMQLGNMASLNPEVLEIPDWDKMVKGNAAMLGVPGKYMKSDAAIKQARKARQEQEQAMLAAQQAQADGEAMQAQGAGTDAMMGDAGNES